jgi:hypothetical protein
MRTRARARTRRPRAHAPMNCVATSARCTNRSRNCSRNSQRFPLFLRLCTFAWRAHRWPGGDVLQDPTYGIATASRDISRTHLTDEVGGGVPCDLDKLHCLADRLHCLYRFSRFFALNLACLRCVCMRNNEHVSVVRTDELGGDVEAGREPGVVPPHPRHSVLSRRRRRRRRRQPPR